MLLGAMALGVRAQDAGPAGAAGPQLDPVVINSQRVPEKAGDTRLSADELVRLPGAGNDPMRAAQDLPGIAVVDDSSTVPAVWGSSPADNAYYIDFIPVGYLFHADGFESVLNPALIRSFDLHTTAFGPEYGDVVGAVFDIGLRDPRTDRLGGQADVALISANALLEGPTSEHTSFFVAGRRSYIDLVRKSVADTTDHIVVRLPSYSDYQGKYLWRPDSRNRFSLNLNGAADTFGFTLSPDSRFALQDPATAGSSYFRTSYRSTAALWELELPSGLRNRFALGRIVEDDAIGVGAAGTVDASSSNRYLREQLHVPTSDNNTVLLGTSLQRQHVDLNVDIKDPRCTEFNPACDYTSAPLVQAIDRLDETLMDAYLDDHWQFLPSWGASVGVRESHDGYLARHYGEPRLGLEWNWSERTLLSARWGRHNEAPTPEQEVPVAGNSRLLHLRSSATVLGISQKEAAQWSWRAELYHKHFDDLVQADPALNYANGVGGSARGLALFVRKEPTTPVFGFVSLSLSRATRRIDATGASFPFDYDEPVILTAVTSYRPSPRWQYGLRWTYHTGAPYTPVIGTGTYPDGRTRPVYGALDSARARNYSRMDLRVDHSTNANFSQYLDVINVYGRGNVSGYSYSANYGSSQPVYQLPRLVSIGIEYKY